MHHAHRVLCASGCQVNLVHAQLLTLIETGALIEGLIAPWLDAAASPLLAPASRKPVSRKHEFAAGVDAIE